MKINELIDIKTKLWIHLIALINVLFLTIYTRLVCPFLNSIPFVEIFRNLFLLFIFQIFLREVMFRFISLSKNKTPPRQLYFLSLVNWLMMGAVGVISYQLYYSPPLISQLKQLSGYWLLGAGICAQIEYLIAEKYYKKHLTGVTQVANYLDHIPQRITESSFIFTLIPAAAMLILVYRYAFEENLLDRSVVWEVLYINVFFLTICLITSYFYGSSLKKDAEKISEAIFKIKDGLFDIKLDQGRTDELGLVSQGINDMASGLRLREKIKEAFGRFVNPKIAEEFIEKYARGEKDIRSKGEKKRLAILMSDIRGFTNMSEVTPPAEITKILNNYFNDMVKVIEDNGGVVDKFIGDAVMAVFGLLEQSESNPSYHAVKAGQEMEKALEKYNSTYKQNIEIGIGIHIGEVIAGYIGSDNRLEYTVIGAPVNLAARIEGETKDVEIPNLVFTQEVADEIGNEIPSKKVKICRPKGIDYDVSLFSTLNDLKELEKVRG